MILLHLLRWFNNTSLKKRALTQERDGFQKWTQKNETKEERKLKGLVYELRASLSNFGDNAVYLMFRKKTRNPWLENGGKWCAAGKMNKNSFKNSGLFDFFWDSDYLV